MFQYENLLDIFCLYSVSPSNTLQLLNQRQIMENTRLRSRLLELRPHVLGNGTSVVAKSDVTKSTAVFGDLRSRTLNSVVTNPLVISDGTNIGMFIGFVTTSYNLVT